MVVFSYESVPDRYSDEHPQGPRHQNPGPPHQELYGTYTCTRPSKHSIAVFSLRSPHSSSVENRR